eukprot:1158900-Pelagomonas_calceolata.AAC.3
MHANLTGACTCAYFCFFPVCYFYRWSNSALPPQRATTAGMQWKRCLAMPRLSTRCVCARACARVCARVHACMFVRAILHMTVGIEQCIGSALSGGEHCEWGAEQCGFQEVRPGSMVPSQQDLPGVGVMLKLHRLPGAQDTIYLRGWKGDDKETATNQGGCCEAARCAEWMRAKEEKEKLARRLQQPPCPSVGHSDAHTQGSRRSSSEGKRAHVEQHPHCYGANPVLLAGKLPGVGVRAWDESL